MQICSWRRTTFIRVQQTGNKESLQTRFRKTAAPFIKIKKYLLVKGFGVDFFFNNPSDMECPVWKGKWRFKQMCSGKAWGWQTFKLYRRNRQLCVVLAPRLLYASPCLGGGGREDWLGILTPVWWHLFTGQDHKSICSNSLECHCFAFGDGNSTFSA